MKYEIRSRLGGGLAATLVLMGPHPSTGRVELSRMFLQTQKEMLTHLAGSELFEQPSACGSVTEGHWIDLFTRYLPQRYQVSSAFVVDADGRCSRQIDIAIFDRLYSPLIFPSGSGGLHVPAESVYAVFEVKQELDQQVIRDAGMKAASVRRLRRTSVPVIAAGRQRPAIHLPHILAGIVALRSGWPSRFESRLPPALARLTRLEALDLGIALQEGAFEKPLRGAVRLCGSGNSLVFFMFRLLERLRALGTAPAADLRNYTRTLF
jgi:hypothetical protein